MNYELHGPIGRERIPQIFHNGEFHDRNRVTGNISTLILSYEKKLAIEFMRKPIITNEMTMRMRRMTTEEIKQNHHGQNNHFNGPIN